MRLIELALSLMREPDRVIRRAPCPVITVHEPS